MQEQIKSKPSWAIIGQILFLSIVSGVLGSYSLINSIRKFNSSGVFHYMAIFWSLLLIVLAIFSLNYILVNIPSIVIDRNGIKISTVFKTKYHLLDEIVEIKLTGKQFLRFIYTIVPVEATTIKFKDGSEFYLVSDFYENKSSLRIVLERIKELAPDFSRLTFIIDNQRPKTKQNFHDDNQIIYGGNHLLTAVGLAFYSFLLMFGIIVFAIAQMTLFSGKGLSTLFLLAPFGYILYHFSKQLHYFKLSSKSLIIHNSIWFWFKNHILFSDIREIVIDRPYGLETSIRIITKDFSDYTYASAQLKDAKWRDLILKLTELKITVRNEAIPQITDKSPTDNSAFLKDGR